MKNDGLDLFVRFAYGAVLMGLCADGGMQNRMNLYLNTGRLTFGEKDIKEGFKTAWPQLEKIAEKIKKKPLSLETVSDYVFGSDDPEINALSHNYFQRVKHTPCMVFAGVIKKVSRYRGTTNVEVISGMKDGKALNFVCFPNSLKRGDKVAFHWGQIIGKLTDEQYRRLTS